ncbi:MAG: hypothetical protein GY725_23100 [bacterium]|nr:hypothetical protein [bacterium]
MEGSEHPPGDPPRANPRARRSRKLTDVLHYFIDEEEQAEALAARSATDPPSDVAEPTGREFEPEATPANPEDSDNPKRVEGRSMRWCIAADPQRMLCSALALDLAAALARRGNAVRVISPFSPSPVVPQPRDVEWQTIEHALADPAAIQAALSDLDGQTGAIVLLPPNSVSRILSGLTPQALDGVLLPVDCAPSGLTRALGWLGRLGTALPNLRIGVTLMGAPDRETAQRLYRKLSGAALRQFGLQIEHLGELPRDQSSDRSLLLGIPVVDVDAQGNAARCLDAVCGRLQ